MKQGLSPAVAVVVIVIVIVLVVLIGWQVFLKKPAGKAQGPQSPEQMKALMQQKGGDTAPRTRPSEATGSPSGGTGSGSPMPATPGSQAPSETPSGDTGAAKSGG